MKKLSLFLGLILFLNIVMQGQVGINPTNSQPDPSAGLDVNFNNKGFLPPRLTMVQRNAIQNPAEGLTIYNTDLKCLEFYTGSASGWYCPCSMSIGAINCANTVVNGNFMVGNPLYPSNTVTISVTPTTIGTYNIFSNMVNGIQFTKTGTFSSTTTQTVTLTGTGMPDISGTTTLTVTYGASSCNFPVYINDGEIIYWGKSSKFILTATEILSELNQDVGFVGGPYPLPKSYTFPLSSEFAYFCIPDLPNEGNRVINLLRTESNIYIATAHDVNFIYMQTNPNPTGVPPLSPVQIFYAKVEINGVFYRLYRSNGYVSFSSPVNVYSID